jgi:sigma-B regulation protein RsbU (phosphoserine phosphatase)
VDLSSQAATILVVDDVSINVLLLVQILASEGFRTLTAADGQSALQRCSSEPVDLILLDVMMPGLSGYEVCASLKSNPSTSEIPVIFISALDDSGNRIAGFSAGGVDYIPKPFYPKEVLARVRVHLRLRQAECMMRQHREWSAELQEAQQSMLVTPDEIPEGCFAVHYRPLDAVGGDIYDVIPLSGDRVGYFVADVSGHGVKASFLTGAVKALLRQYSSPMFTMEDTMRNMNSVLRATLADGAYVTACYARLSKNRRQLTVVSAGHPPLILASSRGGQVIDIESEPLGVFGSLVYQKQEIELQFGDRFYLYTDGLIEDPVVAGCGRAMGLDNLRAACEHRHGLPLDTAVQAIVADVKPGASYVADDILLLGAEIRS